MNIKDNECFISKNALSVILSSASNQSRSILSGLQIINGYAVCADGFMLSRHKIEQGKDFPNSVLTISDLKIAGLPKKPLSVTTDGLLIKYSSGQYIAHGLHNVIVTLISANFLDTNHLFKLVKDEDNTIVGLSTDLLLKLAQILKRNGDTHVILKINKDNNNHHSPPIEFISGIKNGLSGLIMPHIFTIEDKDWTSYNIKNPPKTD